MIGEKKIKLSRSGSRLLVVVVVMVFGILPALASAQADISIQNINIGPGGSTTVPIVINNVTHLIGAYIVLGYNSSVVHVTNIVNGFGLELNKSIDNINGTTGYAVLSLSPLNGTIQFANVTLNAVAASGISPLNLTVIGFNNGTNDMPNTVHNGTFIISDLTPPASITNLQNTTGNFWINWGWNNPPDIDFNYTMVFINGSFVTNTSTNFYISLYPHAIRTISTRTVDTSGNINATWVNQTTQVANNPPVLAHIGNKVIDENQTLTIEMNASDLDGDILTYYPNRTDLFSDFNTATGKGNWTPSFGQAGIYYVNFAVSDGFGGTASETVQITVNHVNRPPSISSVSADKTSVVINETFDVNVTASDPDVGDTLQYQFDWENNGTWSPNQSNDSASHSYTAVGSHTINARVWDNHGASATNNSLVITVSADNTPPNVVNPSANPGEILLEEPSNIDYAHMSTMLNVTATDDSNVSVVAINLSSIGGSANAVMTDIGDDVYSITTNATGTPGLKSLSVNATDIYGNSNTSVSIPLNVFRNGDVDGNGVVNLNDAIYLANHALHVPGFEVINELSSDVDGSGVVNLNDAIYLANHALHVPGYELLH